MLMRDRNAWVTLWWLVGLNDAVLMMSISMVKYVQWIAFKYVLYSALYLKQEVVKRGNDAMWVPKGHAATYLRPFHLNMSNNSIMHIRFDLRW